MASLAVIALLGGLAVLESTNRSSAPDTPRSAVAPINKVPAFDAPAEPVPAPGEKKETADGAPVSPREEIPSPPADKPPPTVPQAAPVKPSRPVTPLAVPAGGREVAKTVPERSATVVKTPAGPAAPEPAARSTGGFRRFLIQVGVFSNPANAEELLARLQAAGIPAQIESRVQVGPFPTRAEARAARARLKELGIDDGLLVRK